MSGSVEKDPTTAQGPLLARREGPRIEDQRLVTGKGCFADDLSLPDQVYCHLLRSPHAHARILSIDTTPVRNAEGVLGVWTGRDLEAAGLGHLTCVAPVQNRDESSMQIPPRPALAVDRVRFVGDPLAMVVAETPAKARDAAEAISIDFDVLEAVVDPAEADKPGRPAIWDFAQGNLAFDHCLGDEVEVEAAFGRAARTVALRLINNRVIPNTIEPRAAIGAYDKDRDRLTLHTACQGGHLLRRALAEDVFKLPLDRIRVVTGDVGGSFGMKGYLYPEYVCALFAARTLGRPVKWTCDRSDSFLSDTHGRDQIAGIELALDSEGRFLAIKASITANLGAYLSDFGPLIPAKGSSLLVGVYGIPAAFVQVKGVYTNTCPLDAYRGAGRPEASFAIERLVDLAAREMGLAPDDIRRRNFVPRSAMPFKTALGHVFDGGDFARNLDAALDAADWDGMERRKAEAARHGRLRGIGLSSYVDACGGAPAVGAKIALDAEGLVKVFVGNQDNGQGQETVYAHLAAGRLGLPLDSIRVLQGDTDLVPPGFTSGSQGLTVGGSAVVLAADRVVAQARLLAAQLLQARSESVAYDAGRFTVADGEGSLSLLEIVRASLTSKRLPEGVSPGLEETVVFTPDAPTYPNGCHVAEVEIDRETGLGKVVNYTAVDDFGRIADQSLVSGQVHGGVLQGIGQALLEQALYDPASGNLVTGSLLEYCLPRADDAPSFQLAFNEVPCSANPLGAKGCAEAGTVAAPAAVVNALVDALRPFGVDHIDMPATPEKLWRAMTEGGNAGGPAGE